MMLPLDSQLLTEISDRARKARRSFLGHGVHPNPMVHAQVDASALRLVEEEAARNGAALLMMDNVRQSSSYGRSLRTRAPDAIALMAKLSVRAQVKGERATRGDRAVSLAKKAVREWRLSMPPAPYLGPWLAEVRVAVALDDETPARAALEKFVVDYDGRNGRIEDSSSKWQAWISEASEVLKQIEASTDRSATTLRSKSTTQLAAGLAEAVAEDERPEVGGFDLSAGLIGPAVSAWLLRVAQVLDENAIAIERAKTTLKALDGHSALDVSGSEGDATFVVVKDAAKALLSELETGHVLPTRAMLSMVDPTLLVDELRSSGHVVSVWSGEDLEFLNDDEALASLSDDQLTHVKHRLLSECELEDRLAETGNDALGQFWASHKHEFIESVLSEVQQEPAEEGRAVESLRGG